MKKLLALLVITFVFTATSFAQDKAADVKRLIEAMETGKTIDAMMNSTVSMMNQQAATQSSGEDARERADKRHTVMMDLAKELSQKLRDEEMPAIYDKYFSHDEIKDLIKFYESPTGKKYVEKSPQFSTDLMQAMQTKYMPEFMERIREKMDELK